MLLTILAVCVALPGAVAVLHLLVLATASVAWRPARAQEPVPRVRFLVLVPARDEATCIGATLTSLRRVMRPGDHLLVVADHCADATTQIARDAGAEVVERDGGTPGRAAARQDGLAAAAGLDWDAVAFVDADCEVEPGYLDACERGLATADVVQARGEAAPARGVLGHAATAAMALQGVVLPRGRDRLGLMVGLRGAGIVLRRDLAQRFGFHATLSEDGMLGGELCLAGIRSRHVDNARLHPRSTTSLADAGAQRVRWEAGRLHNARRMVPSLLRAGTPSALEMALYWSTPSVALAVLALVLGGALATLAGTTALVWTVAALLAGLGMVLVVALVTVHAPPATWLSLLAAPWYVLWKVVLQARAVTGLVRRQAAYPPTPRD